MAIAALQAAVQAGVEDAGIHFIPVAAEAINIRLRNARYRENQKRPNSERNGGSNLHLDSDRPLRFQVL
jgi:hypothetical protein